MALLIAWTEAQPSFITNHHCTLVLCEFVRNEEYADHDADDVDVSTCQSGRMVVLGSSLAVLISPERLDEGIPPFAVHITSYSAPLSAYSDQPTQILNVSRVYAVILSHSRYYSKYIITDSEDLRFSRRARSEDE